MKNTTARPPLKIRCPRFGSLFIATAALMAACAARGQSAFSNAVMSLNPVAYWPLQETAQPPAANIEANNGSLGPIANMYYSTNSLSLIPSIQGPMGNSGRQFTGSSSAYALVPTTDNRVSLPPGGPFTVELWIEPITYNSYDGIMEQTGPIPGGGNNGLFYKAGWVIGQDYFPAGDTGSGTYSGPIFGWTFTVFNGQSMYSGANCRASYEFALKTWYHLVGTFDGTNCALYVDGVPASLVGESVPMPAGTSFLPDTWDPLELATSRGIGANDINEGYSEILIYTNALSALTISNHYYQAVNNGYGAWQSAVTANNPYMYYQMSASSYFPPDPGSLPTASNYGSAAAATTNLAVLAADGYVQNSGIYQAGTLPGLAGPPFSGFGSPSYACAFNALGGAVDAGYAPAMNPTGSTTPETAIGWYKCNPCDDNGRWNSIVSHGDSSWRYKILNGTNVWDAGGGHDTDGPNVGILNVNDGNWHMFAGVYDPVNSNNTIYVDGAQVMNFVTNRSITGNTNLDVFIGGAPDHIGIAGGAQQYMAGCVAHVAYFNAALTPWQIQYLYSAGGAPPSIRVQPASYATTQSGGGAASFSVTATAATNSLLYQWYFVSGGVTNQLAGQNATNIVLNPLVDGDSGSYFVVVANSYGAVTSAMAGLSVSSEPLILRQQPDGALQLYASQNYTLSVTAAGSNLTYQWLTNGVADTTAGTASSYSLTGVQVNMSGNTYQCVVSNALAAASSQLTALTVVPLPASLTNGGTFGSNVMALNPTSYWPMHEAAPGIPGDVETNLGTLGAIANAYYADWDPNDAPIVELTHLEPGPLNGDYAVGFAHGPASYMTVSHQSPGTTVKPPFSVEAWVNPDDADQPGTTSFVPAVIMGQGGGTGLSGIGGYGGFALEYGASGNHSNCFSMRIYTGSGNSEDELSTPYIYPEAQWYHVVSTFDGTNVAIYVNGQPSSSYAAGSTNTTMNPDFWSPLCIGGGFWGASGAANLYQGMIAEPAIYTNVLSAATVLKHYNDGINSGAAAYYSDVTNSYPSLYYRMTAPSYTQPPRSAWPVVTNYGSVAGNGVYLPGVVPGSLGNLPLANVGSAVSAPFSGDGGFADMGMNASLDPLGYTSFSYMAFFKTYPCVLNYSSIMSGNDETWRSEINSAGKIQAHGNADITSTNLYNDGNWHLMVLTAQANATAGNFTNLLYVDGVLAGNVNGLASAGTNKPGGGDPGPEALVGNENGLWIFEDGIPNPPNAGGNGVQGVERSFAGSICEAAFFYGQVLTPSQISSLYAAAGVGPFFGISTNSAYAPYYINQPFKTNVNEGSSFAFTFGPASGSGSALSYQWYSNGIAMPGQTSVTLSLNPVTPTSGASYNVVASSAYGSGTSAVVQVVVNLIPQIVSALPATSPLTVLASSTLDFNVAAVGAAPLKYYWTSNSVLVPSATNSSLVINNILSGDSGTYAVVVSNSIGTATNTWVINVLPVSGTFVPAVIALHPFGLWLMNEMGDGVDATNNGVCHDYINGNDGAYENAITGAPGYNWSDAFTWCYDTNTAADFGPQLNSCALNISNIVVSSPSNGEFSVQAWVQCPAPISDSINTPGIVGKGLYNHEEFALDCGIHLSNYTAYRWSVRNGAETQLDASSTLIAGSDTNWHFLVGVVDQANGNSSLYIDGAKVASVAIAPGAGVDGVSDSVPVMIGARTSAASYAPGSMNEQFTGSIADVAIFTYALTSNQILSEYLAAGIPPQITMQPAPATNVSVGANLTVMATAIGSGSLFFQWLDANSNAVAGQTNPILTLIDVTTNNTYSLFVSNIYGATVSSNFALTVVRGAPVLETDISPTNIAALVGGSVSFTASFAGSPTITYGWQLNGVAVTNNSRISGASATVLTINGLQSSDAGTYQLLATNSFGNSMSSFASLSVYPTLGFNGTGAGWSSQFYSTGGWEGSNVLQLTGDKGSEDAAVFFSSPVYIGAFQASFVYEVPSGPSGSADGATFCIQNDPRGAEAIGGAGGSLGVSTGDVPNTTIGGSITPSVEFEFNIYSGNTAGGVGVAFDTDGNIGPNVVPGNVIINSGDPITTVINYANGVASVTLTDPATGATFTTATNMNIPAVLGTNLAFVGFTASDGGAKSTQTVSDFQFLAYAALSAQVSGGNLLLSWPANLGGYMLQKASDLAAANWTTVAAAPTEASGSLHVSIPAAGAAAYYRLVITNAPSFPQGGVNK